MKRCEVPTIFSVFGVTGDLAQNKIFPALIDLYEKKLLPKKFYIVGIARRDLSNKDFRDFVRKAVLKKKSYNRRTLDSFLDNIEYSQGEFDQKETYQKSKRVFENIDKKWGQCSNKLLYLSVPPALYELILKQIASSGLSKSCDDKHGWTRILIEKPFGKDVHTAQKLDVLLGMLFKEKQIYRIDHYLAKQTLQNIMAFRFSNTIFEPLWNRKHIKSVSINLFENNTVEKRGSFYDENGALRDVGQNHILQMLALVAMDQPRSLHFSDVRTARENIFAKLAKPNKKEVLRAQYQGYLDTAGVAKNSKTETFFSFTSYINNKRFSGVPFYLTSGKALKEPKVEIIINFKDQTPGYSFLPEQHTEQEKNKITISIQPQEKISILFWVKIPGFEDVVGQKELSFSYHDEKTESIDAYEKVLFDCVSGDQTSFVSTKEVLYTWEYIMGVKDIIAKTPLHMYKKGSDPENIKKLSNNNRE